MAIRLVVKSGVFAERGSWFRIGFLFPLRFYTLPSAMMRRFLPLLIGMLLLGSGAAPSSVEQPASVETLGVGLVKPRLLTGQRLYFYNRPEDDRVPAMMPPLDSLVFGEGRHHVDIKSAPPWFWPEVMKMDYGLLLLRARTLKKNWIEVVVNQQTGLTRWVDRQAVEFIDWPTFLLNVVAVEVTDAVANPIRVKPLDHAGILAEAPDIPLPPLAIRGSWMQVSTADVADRMPPSGWIRWRDDDRLLIRYSLLS